jgi:ABC transport system ATP-binding/permease protein
VILLDIESVAASRPGRPLFADVSFTLGGTDRLGIVGLNGCGKSTLLGIIAGSIEPEAGRVRRGRDVRIAVLGQDPRFPEITVREAVTSGHDRSEWEAAAVADRLGLGDLFDEPVSRLSGGQSKRVALARALVAESDLLVLDEPTNHLDIDAIAWLEERLANYRGGLVLVTHDRHFLDRITTRVLELDRGASFLHDGGYAGYLEGRARREELAERAETKRRNLARTELAWLRRGAPARTSKPKARIEAATATVEGRAQAPARAGELPLHTGIPRLGDKVVDLVGVGHGFDGRTLFSGLELRLDNRERLGIVGANGTGKSTLLDIISGRVEPVEGLVDVGATARIGYYDQRGRDLDPQQRVRDAVTGGQRDADWSDAALMEAFWFDGDAQWAPVGLLSGGERRRLQLLLTLAERPNVLLLDEPTNDLDLDTLRQLEDFLEEWPGALVVVSHDRAFLERTVADVVVLDGEGDASRRPGGYAAYEEERRLRRRTGTLGRARGGDERDNASGAVDRADAVPDLTGGAPPVSSPSTLRHQLRRAGRELAAVQRRHAELVAEMERLAADGDHLALTELGEALAAVGVELDGAEERWLGLASEAEERGLAV